MRSVEANEAGEAMRVNLSATEARVRDLEGALQKVAGILRNESFALRIEAALEVIDEALS